MEALQKAPPAVEKPVIDFEREYVRDGNHRYHVIRFEYDGESYETRKRVPHGEETLPFSEVSKQFKRGINTFQRTLRRTFQDR